VLEWAKGTALRPVLAALDEEQGAAFLAEYGDRLRGAYKSGFVRYVLPIPPCVRGGSPRRGRPVTG